MIQRSEAETVISLRRKHRGVLGAALAVFVVFVASAVPAFSAGLIITPTFDSSITNDPNAALIMGAINSAIAEYESIYANPININIYFQEGGGLGSSVKALYGVNYTEFRAGLAANQAISGQADQATALASLPIQINNPVTGNPAIAMCTANIKAIGGPELTGIVIGGNNYDGQITLNTSLTFPGSPGSAAFYSLKVVAEHEIDEVLGLGSSLAQSFQNFPSPEDLYRYASAGVRSYTTNSNAKAFFSIDGGNTLLVQFDNQNDGGDWGDWQSNPLPNGVAPKVQDAFATPFATPALGVELTALDVIGYYRFQPQAVVPEPTSLFMVGVGMLTLSGFTYSRRIKRRVAPRLLSDRMPLFGFANCALHSAGDASK
jgi:hypothetical protein